VVLSAGIRVNGKEWKTQHQIPEFGHKQGEMKKTPCKNLF
jgi:hypothetical protein